MRPIDVEKAIEIIETKQKELCPVGRYGRNYVYGTDREKYDAWDEIIDALENLPTLTPPNEPLSWTELLKMDGEPVYVVFRPDGSGEKPQFWALVSADKQHGEVYLLDSMGGAGSYDEIWANLEGIYRRPPERQEDT